MNTPTFKIGDQVKYSKPLNSDEEKQTFTVVEVDDKSSFLKLSVRWNENPMVIKGINTFAATEFVHI